MYPQIYQHGQYGQAWAQYVPICHHMVACGPTWPRWSMRHVEPIISPSCKHYVYCFLGDDNVDQQAWRKYAVTSSARGRLEPYWECKQW